MSIRNLVKSVALYIKVIVSRFSKAIYYSAIPVIAFLSLTNNSAVAADTATLGAADAWNDNDSGSVDGDVIAAGDHVSGLEYALTLNTLSDNKTIGDITMTSGHITVVNTTNEDAMTMTVNSITSTGAGNLDIDMITTEDALTLTITAAMDIGGTLNFTNADSGADSAGILDIGGASTVDGTTTLVPADDGDVTMKMAKDATFTGVTSLADDTGLAILMFDGTTAQTVTFGAAVGGGTAGEGTIDVANTTEVVTFVGAIGSGTNLLEVEVSAGAEAVFKSTIAAITFDIDNDVTLYENAHAIGTTGGNAGSLNFAASAVMTLNDTIVAGETVFNGELAKNNDTGIVIVSTTFNMPSNFTSGTITFWDSDAGDTTTDVANTTMNDTALTDYTANTADSDQDLTFTVSKKSDATCASELSVNTDVCNAFEQARDSAISDTNADASAEDAFTTVLNQETTSDTQLAKQVAPQTDGFMGVAQSVSAVNSSIMGIASTRLASLRQGDGFATGFAAGSSSLSSSIFIKPFGHLAEGNAHGGVAGFETQTRGISFGFDHVTRGGAVIGLSYSTSETEVDGDGAGNVEHDFDTQQLTFYGDYSTDKVYIEAMVGLARNDNDTSRTIAEGGINRTAKGSYDSYQASFSVSGGVPLRTNKNGYVTPILSLSTSLLNSDDYTETGATNLNLKIDPDDYFSAITALGFRWHGVIDHKKGGTSVPEFRIGAGYDVSNDTVSTKALFTGGGSSFTVDGISDDRVSATVGLGYTLSYGGVSFGINADVIAKEHGAGGSASAELKVKF